MPQPHPFKLVSATARFPFQTHTVAIQLIMPWHSDRFCNLIATLRSCNMIPGCLTLVLAALGNALRARVKGRKGRFVSSTAPPHSIPNSWRCSTSYLCCFNLFKRTVSWKRYSSTPRRDFILGGAMDGSTFSMDWQLSTARFHGPWIPCTTMNKLKQ